jgi:predicted 3-demethylubiquinone-9 3-methyltransferase (glyoxalase superfamily)
MACQQHAVEWRGSGIFSEAPVGAGAAGASLGPIRAFFAHAPVEEPPMPKLTPFLWFDDQAEEAANFYVSVFPNSKFTAVGRVTEAGPGQPGAVQTVSFELDGKAFTAINGGPYFHFTEAISFVVDRRDQAEVDRYWEALTSGGGQPGQCGWLKDRYGVSWQVVPDALFRLSGDPDPARARRATQAMLKMSKLDVAELEAAANGEG